MCVFSSCCLWDRGCRECTETRLPPHQPAQPAHACPLHATKCKKETEVTETLSARSLSQHEPGPRSREARPYLAASSTSCRRCGCAARGPAPRRPGAAAARAGRAPPSPPASTHASPRCGAKQTARYRDGTGRDGTRRSPPPPGLPAQGGLRPHGNAALPRTSPQLATSRAPQRAAPMSSAEPPHVTRKLAHSHLKRPQPGASAVELCGSRSG